MQEQVITVEGLPARFFAAGDGPPLLLLHGNGDSKFSWSWVIPELARAHRVYALDVPRLNAGASPASAPTSASYARFVAAFMDGLGIGRAAVVGSSFGGLIAARLALTVPERVSTLGLVDSAGLGAAVNPLLQQLALPGYGDLVARWGQTGVGARQWAWMRAALVFARPGRAPASWIAEQDRLARLPGFGDATVAVLRSLVGWCGQRDLVLGQLGRLTMPALVLWGRDDRIFPACQARVAATLLRCGQLAVIPDCGHLPHVERPDRCADILGRFLAGGRIDRVAAPRGVASVV
jgi:4,5:9,10-diseco-3-hydroxy-5,9,17-trioxoandrosta-1(10),2-diene-4-oate hydrolase